MSNLPTILFVGFAVALIVWFTVSRDRKLRASRASIEEAQVWYEANLPIASNPDTELTVLRGYLAMENPHDATFFARLAVLRALSQNPSLPVELQAAAINRVSQEEATARIDKSLAALAKAQGRARGFVGFSTDI